MKNFPPLKEVTLEITQQCFLNCLHCSSLAFAESQQHLMLDEITRLANDFEHLGVKRIEISGGEPLLHKNLFTYLNLFKNKGFTVELYTCGGIDQNNDFENELDEILAKLHNSDVDKIIFGLHGAKAETHNGITRTPESFSQAIQFIRKLVDAEYYVGIHYVPMTPNFEEFEDLIDFATRLGIREIRVLRFVPQGRGAKHKDFLALREEESAKLIELLAQSKKRKDINVKIGSHLNFTFMLDGEPPSDCNAGREKCLIQSDGAVIPCPVFKGQKEYVAGSIKKTSLAEIWKHSDVFNQFRDFDPNSLKGTCATCQFLLTCKGRCPAQRIYDTGDFYQGPDSYCPKEFFAF